MIKKMIAVILAGLVVSAVILLWINLLSKEMLSFITMLTKLSGR
jgi:hypothetical protein